MSDNPPATGTAGDAGLTRADLEALQATNKDLNTSIRELIELAKSNQNRPAPTAAAPVEEPEEEPEDDDGDLETLSRAQFANVIGKRFLKAVEAVVKPLSEQIGAIDARTTAQQIGASVQELQSKHKDFWEWRDEMLSLANEHRGMPPAKLYVLARGLNPEKAAELDKKHNPPVESKKILLAGFGGLTPSQAGTGTRGRKMNGTEASEVAWAETVAALGGEPVFEE
jgi:hypothetical protein